MYILSTINEMILMMATSCASLNLNSCMQDLIFVLTYLRCFTKRYERIIRLEVTCHRHFALRD